MEEIQSWWEVPAIAHFFYVFRRAFDLIYFEIAELESALLGVQDHEMSISCEQLIMRLLQGFENELVTTENWDRNLRELFDENLDDCENPYSGESEFFQLSPRQKLDILYKLCEMRLEVEGALDEIKDIKNEEMRAKCLGKDQQNNVYWYFYDERLYKENPHLNKKKTKAIKVKSTKSSSDALKKSERSIREKTENNDSKALESPWSIACFTLSDWDELIKQFCKSRSVLEKDLVANLKAHISMVEESILEKNRILRKRFMKLAPKRQSSRLRGLEKKREEENAKRQRFEEEIAEKQRLLDKVKLAKQAQAKREHREAVSEKALRLGLRVKTRIRSDSEEEAPEIKQSSDSPPDSSGSRVSERLRLRGEETLLSTSEDERFNKPTEALSKDSPSKGSATLRPRTNTLSTCQHENEDPKFKQPRKSFNSASVNASSTRNHKVNQSAIEEKVIGRNSKQLQNWESPESNLTSEGKKSQESQIAETNLVVRTSSRLKAKTDSLAHAESERNCKSGSSLIKTRSSVLLNDAPVIEESSFSVNGLDSISEDLRMIQSRTVIESETVQPFVNGPVRKETEKRKIVSTLEKNATPVGSPKEIKIKQELHPKMNFPILDIKKRKLKVDDYKCVDSGEIHSCDSKTQNRVCGSNLSSASPGDDGVEKFRGLTFSEAASRYSKEKESLSRAFPREGNEEAHLGHGQLRNINVSGKLKPRTSVLNACEFRAASVPSRKSSQKSPSPKQSCKGFEPICKSPVKSSANFFTETSLYDNDTKFYKMNYQRNTNSNNSDLTKKSQISQLKIFKEKQFVPHAFSNRDLHSDAYSQIALKRPKISDERPEDSNVTKFPIIIRSYKTGSSDRLRMLEL